MKRGMLYVEYEVAGDDADRFLAILTARKIPFYGCKNTEKGKVLTIDFKDSKKFFAISQNMCYNIRRIRYKGKFAFFKYALENIGILVGFVGFAVAAYFADGIVSEISYAGDGDKLGKEISAVLSEEGIKTGSRLSVGTDELGKKIYASSDEFAFVSVKKSGGRLIIEAYKRKVPSEPLNVARDILLCPEDGEVVYLNCMSGKPVVAAGDRVKKGDALVVGKYSVNDKDYDTYVLAEVEIACEFVYIYESAGTGELYVARAEAVALNELGDKEVLSVSTEERANESGNAEYIVTVKYSVTVT